MAWYSLVSYSYISHGLTSAGGQMFSCFISVRTRENITVYLTQILGSTHLAFKHPTSHSIPISGLHFRVTPNPFVRSLGIGIYQTSQPVIFSHDGF